MYTKGLNQCETKIQTKYTLASKIVHFRTRMYGAVFNENVFPALLQVV